MSYRKNANSNRDALFGSSSKKKATRPQSTISSSSKPSSGAPKTAVPPSSRGYQAKPRSAAGAASKINRPSISPEVKATKLKEAEDYKQKAAKAMESGFFQKPDPVAASTFYKRAADCYQLAQESRLERLFRLQSADCNWRIAAWASAAGDYARAAELVLEAPDETVEIEQSRRDASSYYKRSSEAWLQLGEKAKAAEAQIQAALAILGSSSLEEGILVSKEAMTGLEEAIEAFVPDVFNPYARYRQTGRSAFIAENETIDTASPESLQLAESHVVTRSYSFEPIQKVVSMLVRQGEYPSALYAAGAATVLLERDGVSTLTLGRAYCTETILMLAQGDPIGAEERFLNKHCQNTPYLTSRESKLAEDLFRAIKQRDPDALEEARSPSGSNRAALANLDESLRVLVTELRLSGVARRNLPGDSAPTEKTSSSKKSSKKSSKEAPPEKPLSEVLKANTGYEQDVVEGENLNPDVLQDELEALNFGDGDDDDNESLEDDDIDLR